MKSFRKFSDEKGIGIIIVSLISLGVLTISLFSKPAYIVEGHTFILDQSTITPGLVLGISIWAIIELFTRGAKGIVDLIVRPVIGYILGLIFGGFLGYEFNFGQYVVVAAMSGNPAALYFLFSIFAFVIVMIADAAFAHRRKFIN
jgi:hypothetical protein